ncbi:alpha-2-macroglobulin-like protein [Plakobranchus ocellatus]|uniref:Alpha-2-macroglobulin-like protein n=1 Tax=Plakobranchus ocellatus TaxID=259542 RepID=A0AAV4AHT7_9GAST|nr:alpha-2-macroglobulin-like protein [Plakobranchus ocellatus]
MAFQHLNISVLLFSPKTEIVLTEKVPDTITTWSATAMCVNQRSGFRMSEVAILKTYQPLVVSAHMPRAAVVGERLPVTVTVHNKLHKCIKVRLTIEWNANFTIHNNPPNPDPVCVCGGENYTKNYYATPHFVGSLPVEAKATVVASTCKKSRDIDLSYTGISHKVHRKIRVKYPGAEQSYTYASYFCSEDGKPISEEVYLQLPKGKELVRNSAHGQVQVIGDIMGAALNSLEYLVRMPTGCGEQNMIGFVSNILVLNYLNDTGNLQENTRQAAVNNMKIGYQRALQYRHQDGSFSAFGNKDPKGSIWLTSFVVKSFAKAQKHIFIDEMDLKRSIHFLFLSQLETGCFRETGKVLSSYMMGGLGQGWGQKNRRSPQGALTAHVLMALMEAGADTNDPSIKLGIQCMNRELHDHKSSLDPYTLALVTLANIKYNSTSPDAQFAFNKLNEKALKDDKHIYWTRGHKRQPPTANTKFYPTAPSAEVEMASYALMSYLQFSPNQAEKIAMWLSRQRNSFGGFASTQDTVVALDALSQFATSVYSRDPTELKVKVTFTSAATWSIVEFYVPEDDRFKLQSKPIPVLPTTLHISTSGTGCALVQANVHYNKPAKEYVKGEKPNFTLKIFTRKYRFDPKKCDYRTLIIKIKSRRVHFVSKGMGLLTLRMVTGWSPTPRSLTALKSSSPALGIKRLDYEEEEGVLHVYFDEFGRKAKRFKVDVVQDQNLRVPKPKLADARVVEYYETGVITVQRYRIKTTCRSKTKKPDRKKGNTATKANNQQTLSASAGTSSKCPECITSWKIPPHFHDEVCNASAVYRVKAGRKGRRPLRLRKDLRPRKIVDGLRLFVFYQMPPGCYCPLFSRTGGPREVIIVTTKKVSGKYLTLDRNSIIMKATRKASNKARAAQKTCPHEEKE